MKLPTLTAITLASAVLAAGPAFAAGTPGGAATTPTPPPAAAAQPSATATTAAPATTPAPKDNATAATTAAPAATPAPEAKDNATAATAAAPATATPATKGSGMTATTTAPEATTPATNGSAMTTTATAPEATTTPATEGNANALPAAGGATAGQMALTNNPPGSANVVPQTNGNDNANAKNERTPNERNPVLANNGRPLASKVIGSAVYNASDKKVGSVNDILMSEGNRPDMAVVNLSEGDKRVLVPFREFVFGNTKISGDNRVLLPSETPMSLAQLAPFHYHLQNTAVAGNGMETGAIGVLPGERTTGPVPAGHRPLSPPVTAAPPVTTAMNANGAAAPNDTGAVAPAVANPSIGTATVKTKNNNNDNNANAALPHQRNPVLADNGMPRASHVIGSGVYNSQDQKLGTVNQIQMGENGAPDQAVIAVNNGNNHHELVPFRKLVFGNTRISGNNRVILPDATVAQLDQLPPFVYNGNGNGNG